MGWQPQTDTGATPQPWQPPGYNQFIGELQTNVLPPVIQMLSALAGADPKNQAGFTLTQPIRSPAQQGASGTTTLSSNTNLPPLAMLLLSAGSDPFASLGLGFGTAYPIDIVDKPSPFDYMVTVEHQIFGLSFELADFVIAPQLIPPPGAPLNVSALLHASTRPKDRDLPWTEAVDVLWDRALPLLVARPRPASYCVARFAPPPDPSAILLGKRFSGGWVPFAPTQRDDDSSSVQVLFSDGDVRSSR